MMTQIFHLPAILDDPYRQRGIVAAKRYEGSSQFGIAVKCKDGTEEARLDAEAHVLNSLNLQQRRLPTWEGRSV